MTGISIAEDDPLAAALLIWARAVVKEVGGTVDKSASDILQGLSTLSDRAKWLPQSAKALADDLTRLKSPLEAAGVRFERLPRNAKSRPWRRMRLPAGSAPAAQNAGRENPAGNHRPDSGIRVIDSRYSM